MIVIVKARYALRCTACHGEGGTGEGVCTHCFGHPRMRPEIKVTLRACRLGSQRTTFDLRRVHAISHLGNLMCGTKIEPYRLKKWWGVYSEITCQRCLRHEFLSWDASAQARFV